MIKNSLFYMANAHPEIGRLFSYHKSGKHEAAENAQKRAIDIVETILAFDDVSLAGKTEWSIAKECLADYKNLDDYQITTLERFAEPFAYKFMNNYSNN